nr:PREDICTED: nucleoside diphosphate kinase 6 isoform X2 [Linepithema humile]
MQSKKYLQLTLAILKPHIVKSPFALQKLVLSFQKIRDIIIDNNFKVVKSRRTTISREEVELFYREHKDKFFYNRLMTFMCSGPSDIYILAEHDAVVKWRQLMGPTKVYQAQYNAPDTIRGMFGLSDTRNAAHGSESAEREIAIFFKEFNIKKWYNNEEIFYNLGRLHFDPISFVHTIDKNFVEMRNKPVKK